MKFNPLHEEFSKNSNKIFKNMRINNPVYKHGKGDWSFLSIFKYKDIQRQLLDISTWSSDMKEVERLVLGDAAILIQNDPPEHTLLKSIINPLFTKLNIYTYENIIREKISSILEENHGKSINFSEDIAAKISLFVICEFVGIPIEQSSNLRYFTNKLSNNVGLEFLEIDKDKLDDQAYRVNRIHEDFSGFFQELMGTDKKNTLIHLLNRSTLSKNEIAALVKSISFAGNHSSSILISNAVSLLYKNPDQIDLMLKENLFDNTIEEVLRFKPTFRVVNRVAMKDGQIRGIPYYKGEYLMAWLSSANRDEDFFINSDDFNIKRSYKKHLSFSAGPHYCIGSHIVKLTLRLFLEDFFRKYKLSYITTEPNLINDAWVDGFEDLKVRYEKI